MISATKKYAPCTWQRILEKSKELYGSDLYIQDQIITEVMGYQPSTDGKRYLNTLRGEKKPDCLYRISTNRLIYLTDYGNAYYNGMNCFDLLMEKSKYDVRPIKTFAECLKVINEKYELGLGANQTTEISHKPRIKHQSFQQRLKTSPKGRPEIRIKAYDGFTLKALDYWSKFSIDPVRFNMETPNEVIYQVEKYYYTTYSGAWVEVIPTTLCFAFHFEDTGHFKIYTPHAEDGKMKWFSNCDEEDVFGKDCYDEDFDGIITKSWKDRTALVQADFDAVAFQNEGCIPDFKGGKYILFDNDNAGIVASEVLLKSFPHLIAIFIDKKYGVKDVGEFVERYGVIRMKQHIKELIL